MKRQLRGFLILIFVAISFAKVNAANINTELSGSISMIQRVDTKKRSISMNGASIAYGSNTIIYDASGKKTDASALKSGLAISFDYDKDRRYISMPLATKIWIKSTHPMKRSKK